MPRFLDKRVPSGVTRGCRRRLECRRHPPHTVRPNCGFTILELTVTMILLGGAMAIMVPLLGRVNAQRRAAESRRIAVQEAANILERFTVRDWDGVTQQAADAVRLSADANSALREPRLKVTVSALPQQPAAKRVLVELRWKNREGQDVSPARLVTFLYRTKGTP